MSAEENKALVCRWYDEVINRHDPGVIDALFAPDFVSHQPGGAVHGLSTWRGVITDYLNAFPDYQLKVESIVAEGDLVATRWTATGTQTGPFRGIAPTGEAVKIPGMGFHRVADGKVAETWSEFDWHGFLHTLGQKSNG